MYVDRQGSVITCATYTGSEFTCSDSCGSLAAARALEVRRGIGYVFFNPETAGEAEINEAKGYGWRMGHRPEVRA
jgi:hypothetical protein